MFTHVHNPAPSATMYGGSPVRGDMFVERAGGKGSSPVGAACPLHHVSPLAEMPPLRGWAFDLSGFYKPAVPTGLDTGTNHLCCKHSALMGPSSRGAAKPKGHFP